MTIVHPSASKVEALRRRWEGQEYRLRSIAQDLRAGRDWTVHLFGLPYVEEVPPLPGDACGRDLRGADLRRLLRPAVEVRPAGEREAALVAAIALEGLRTNTALPGVSPFPSEVEGAAGVALAMRRGDRFLLARCDGEPVGTVRTALRREFVDLTGGAPYLEISALAVLPAWRRTGIGGRLLDEAEALGLADGHPWLLLRTVLEVGLVPWYRGRGYRDRRVRQVAWPGAPTCLDVVMTRKLDVPAGLEGQREDLQARGAPCPDTARAARLGELGWA